MATGKYIIKDGRLYIFSDDGNHLYANKPYNDRDGNWHTYERGQWRVDLYNEATDTFTCPFSATNLPPWSGNSGVSSAFICDNRNLFGADMSYFFYNMPSLGSIWMCNAQVEFGSYATGLPYYFMPGQTDNTMYMNHFAEGCSSLVDVYTFWPEIDDIDDMVFQVKNSVDWYWSDIRTGYTLPKPLFSFENIREMAYAYRGTKIQHTYVVSSAVNDASYSYADHVGELPYSNWQPLPAFTGVTFPTCRFQNCSHMFENTTIAITTQPSVDLLEWTKGFYLGLFPGCDASYMFANTTFKLPAQTYSFPFISYGTSLYDEQYSSSDLNCSHMFEGVTTLYKISLTGFTSYTSTECMFKDTDTLSIRGVTLNNLNNSVNATSMFENSTTRSINDIISSIIVKKNNTNAYTLDRIFYGCSRLGTDDKEIQWFAPANTRWDIDLPAGSTGVDMFVGTNPPNYNSLYNSILEANNVASGNTAGYFNNTSLFYLRDWNGNYYLSNTPYMSMTEDHTTSGRTTLRWYPAKVGSTFGLSGGNVIRPPWADGRDLILLDKTTLEHLKVGGVIYGVKPNDYAYISQDEFDQVATDNRFVFPADSTGLFAYMGDTSLDVDTVRIYMYSIDLRKAEHIDYMFYKYSVNKWVDTFEFYDSSSGYGYALPWATDIWDSRENWEKKVLATISSPTVVGLFKEANYGWHNGDWANSGLPDAFLLAGTFDYMYMYTTDFTSVYEGFKGESLIWYFNGSQPLKLTKTFYNCPNLKEIMLDYAQALVVYGTTTSNWQHLDNLKLNYNLLTNAEYCFAGCPNLTAIYTSPNIGWDLSISDTEMFRGSESLPNFNDNWIGVTEAHCLYTVPTTRHTYGYFTGLEPSDLYWKRDDTKKAFYLANHKYDDNEALTWNTTVMKFIDQDLGTPWDWHTFQIAGYSIKVDERELNGLTLPENINNLFANGHQIASIETENMHTYKVKSMHDLFAYTWGITTLNLGGWDTHNVEDVEGMFMACTSLTSITGLGNLNVDKCTSFNYMFSGCSKLATIDVTGWHKTKTLNITSTYAMFHGCSLLTSVKIPMLSKVVDVCHMYEECTSLQTVDVPISGSNVKKAVYMFANCTSLETITMGWWYQGPTSDGTFESGAEAMFYNCSNLSKIDVGGGSVNWNKYYPSDITWCPSDNMFYGCVKLPFFDPTCLDIREANNTAAGSTPGYFSEPDVIPFYYWYDVDNLTVHFRNDKLNEKYKAYPTMIEGVNPWGGAKTAIFESDGRSKAQCILPGNCDFMFHNCTVLRTLESDWNYTVGEKTVVNCNYMNTTEAMFLNCKSMYYDNAHLDFRNSTNLDRIAMNSSSKMSNIIIPESGVMKAESAVSAFEGVFYWRSNELGFSFENLSWPYLKDATRMFAKLRVAETESGIYYSYGSVQYWDRTVWESGCTWIFPLPIYGMTALETVEEMFEGSQLASSTYSGGCVLGIEVNALNVSSIKNFNGMFKNCEGVSYIDVQDWEFNGTSDVTMDSMFEGSTNLYLIKAKDNTDWKQSLGSRITSSTDMFTSDIKLPDFNDAYTTITEANNTGSGNTDGYFGGFRTGFFYKVKTKSDGKKYVYFSNTKYSGYNVAEIPTDTHIPPWSDADVYGGCQYDEGVTPQVNDTNKFKFPANSDYWFNGCTKLNLDWKEEDADGNKDWHWDTSDIESANYMMSGTHLNMNNSKTSKTDGTSPYTMLMFNDWAKCTTFEGFYKNCINDGVSKILDISATFPTNSTNFSHFLDGITNVEIIEANATFGSKSINMDYFFANMPSLVKIKTVANTDWNATYNMSGTNVFSGSPNVANYQEGVNGITEANNTGSGTTLGYFGERQGYYYKLDGTDCTFSNKQYDGYLSAVEWRTNGTTIPWIDATSLSAKSGETFKLPDDASYWFGGCHDATFNGSGMDTSEVLDMDSMFKNCYNITFAPANGINNWDTSKVKTVAYMFRNARYLTGFTGLPTTWDMSSCTNAIGLFKNFRKEESWEDRNGTYIYVPNSWPVLEDAREMFMGSGSNYWYVSINAPELKNASYMFSELRWVQMGDYSRGKNSIVQLDANFPKCEDFQYMFAYPHLEETSASGGKAALLIRWENSEDDYLTPSATNFNSLFRNCGWGCSNAYVSPSSFDDFDTSKVTDFSNLLRFDGGRDSLDTSRFSTSFLFDWIYRLYLTQWNLSSAETIDYMFYGDDYRPSVVRRDRTVTTLEMNWGGLRKLKSAVKTFSRLTALRTLSMEYFRGVSIEDTTSMFEDCTALEEINFKRITWEGITNWADSSRMFYNCRSLTTIYGGDGVDWCDKATPVSDDAFYGCTSIPYFNNAYITFTEANNIASGNTPGYLYTLSLYYKIDGDTCLFSNRKAEGYTLAPTLDSSTTPPWSNCKTLTCPLGEEVCLTKNSQYLFAKCNFTSFDPAHQFRVDYVENMEGMFSETTSTSAFNLSYWAANSKDNMRVTNTSKMFSSSKFATITLDGVDLSKVTTVDEMFKSSIATMISFKGTRLGATGSALTSADKTFYGDTALAIIYASAGTDWNAIGVTGEDVFRGCSRLKEFRSAYLGISEANNTGSGNTKGYFTATDSGAIKIKVNGVWKNAIPYIKINGVWKQCTPFVKVSGVWKESTL